METRESAEMKLERSGHAQGAAQFFPDSFCHPRPGFFRAPFARARARRWPQRNKYLLYSKDSEGKSAHLGCPDAPILTRRGKGVCEKTGRVSQKESEIKAGGPERSL